MTGRQQGGGSTAGPPASRSGIQRTWWVWQPARARAIHPHPPDARGLLQPQARTLQRLLQRVQLGRVLGLVLGRGRGGGRAVAVGGGALRARHMAGRQRRVSCDMVCGRLRPAVVLPMRDAHAWKASWQAGERPGPAAHVGLNRRRRRRRQRSGGLGVTLLAGALAQRHPASNRVCGSIKPGFRARASSRTAVAGRARAPAGGGFAACRRWRYRPTPCSGRAGACLMPTCGSDPAEAGGERAAAGRWRAEPLPAGRPGARGRPAAATAACERPVKATATCGSRSEHRQQGSGFVGAGFAARPAVLPSDLARWHTRSRGC